MLLAEGGHIGDGSVLKRNIIIGAGVTVGCGAHVYDGAKLQPGKNIPDNENVFAARYTSPEGKRRLFESRGITGGMLEINPVIAAKIGMAYGSTLPAGSNIMCGTDVHAGSGIIFNAAVSGILSSGVNVINTGQLPHSVFCYNLGRMGESGGLYVRKAYKNPLDIEMKFYSSDGMALPGYTEKVIETVFFNEDFRIQSIRNTGKTIFPHRLVENYSAGFLGRIDPAMFKKQEQIVVDYAFSPLSSVFPGIFRKLNLDVISVNSYIDESKLSRSYPEFINYVDQISNMVKTTGAEAGFVFDSFGERIFVIDDRGEHIPEREMLNIFASLFMKNFPGATIAVPVTASSIVEEKAVLYGSHVIRIPTGAKNLVSSDIIRKAKFLGDCRGRYVLTDFQKTLDGAYAAVKLLEFSFREGKALSEIRKDTGSPHFMDRSVPCGWHLIGNVLSAILDKLTGEKLDLIDGIKIYREKGWILLLPDAAHPRINLLAESADPDWPGLALDDFEGRIRAEIGRYS